MQNRTRTEQQNYLPKVLQQVKVSGVNKNIQSTAFSGL